MLRNLPSDSKLHDAALYYTLLYILKSSKLRQLIFITYFGDEETYKDTNKESKNVLVHNNNISVRSTLLSYHEKINRTANCIIIIN